MISYAEDETRSGSQVGFFSKRPPLLWLALTILFTVSFTIRIYRLGEPPLRFHPARQYWGALVARSYYYSRLYSAPQWMRSVAASQDPRTIAEPPILEGVTLALYWLTGGVHLWIPRLLSSLFWLAGGVALYLLVKKVASVDAAVVSTAFYLLLPYGVFASRTFMPNPLMVMMLLVGVLAIAWYDESPSMPRAVVAGVVAALAILIEPYPFFMIFGAFIALTVHRQGIRESALDPQSWAFSVVALSPAATYYGYNLFVVQGQSQILSTYIKPHYLLDPFLYRYWLAHIQHVIGFGAVIVALLGVLLFRKGVPRALVVGLWCGYLLYGLVFTYHMRTHDYYQLPLIPLVALSLGPVGALVLARLDEIATRYVQVGVLSILALAMVLAVGVTGSELGRQDFEDAVHTYEEVGQAVHHSTNTVYLTEHYGFALEYHGWLHGRSWPCASYARAYGGAGLSDLSAEERFLADYSSDSLEYFIITNLQEFEEQADLRNFLGESFPIVARTEEYLIFDLSRPVASEGEVR